MPYRLMEPRFPLGEVYGSTTAERLGEDALLQILHRYHCGDWGDLGEGDKRANEEALEGDERILSRYDLECGSFYIITEANCSVTTVMAVEEYRERIHSCPLPRHRVCVSRSCNPLIPGSVYCC